MAASKPNVESNTCRGCDARERRGRIGIGRRILRAAGITIPHAGRISFRAMALASLLLASCWGSTRLYTVQSAVLTPGNDDCRAADYEGLVETHLRNLRGQERDRIVRELSKIAAKIWRMKSRPEETCRVKFTIVNPDPLRIPHQYIFYFSIVTFIVDEDNVCLSHYVWEHPHYSPPGWRSNAEQPYVPKNRGEHWLPRNPGPYFSFESPPVCFDKA